MYSITRYPNGTALLIDRRSGLRGLFDSRTGNRRHGDITLRPAEVLALLAK